MEATTGNWRDLIDDKPFSTEFSHTRFLVPKIMGYKGWALFMDADMLFLTDIKKLLSYMDDTKAVMCVKHNHVIHPNQRMKMDGREQLAYRRKNWSSFMLINCAHPQNRSLRPADINTMTGQELHALSWLNDEVIGSLPFSYNYISGVSPALEQDDIDVVHYTEGGPWFEKCKEVPYAQAWLDEHMAWQESGGFKGIV